VGWHQKPQKPKMKNIWLSHPVTFDSPRFGGEVGLVVEMDYSMERGNPLNASSFKMSAHLGSHVDCPKHFIEGGKVITDYEPDEWVFEAPMLVDIETSQSHLVCKADFPDVEESVERCKDVDLLFIRTGWEKIRKERVYWEFGPGIDPDLPDLLISLFPNLKAVGMDILSVSSSQHIKIGWKAHQAFLEKGIRIFEDLALKELKHNQKFIEVLAFPLRIEGCEAGPCSIIARVE
jgi:arylformamidase